MRLYISFKAPDFNRYAAALKRLETSVPTIADNMCRYGAIEYKTEVLQAIASQNFVTRIPRLTKNYLKWKVSHGFPSSIGIMQYDLLNNIKAFQMPGGWFGGVDPNARDSGGKNWSLRGPSNLVVKYAIWLEEGNRLGESDRQRPRPIFMPIARRYQKSGYPQQINKAAKRIELRWH